MKFLKSRMKRAKRNARNLPSLTDIGAERDMVCSSLVYEGKL